MEGEAREGAATAPDPTETARARTAQRQRAAQQRRGNPITRLANQWFDRVMGAISEGGLSEQEAQYGSHKTTKDFIWNTVGVGAWGMVFPILTMIATQLVGVEQAGMFSMAFVVGSLLFILANFGVRTYQISDVEEVHSFADYQVSRWITCVLMVVVGCLYCAIRGYDAEMFYLSVGVFLYRMVDGLADVYEGRLQQVDKLYLAGISQALRSVLALVVFAILLVISRNMVAASFGMAIAAAATFVVVTYPLTLLETPKSRKVSLASVAQLFKNTAPLFVALFLYALIDNMPKFVMEGALSYDNQLYFNALYFPAQGILITSQLVYKPLLVRMAGVWQDGSKRRQFDLIMVGILGVILAVTAANVLIMAWVGIPVMSFLYGIDFEQFRGLMYIMLAAGGVTAAIDFMYQVITVMRRQKDVTTLYLVTFGFSLFVPILLVMFTGLPGAVIGYLIVMTLLFVLLVWEYFRIRKDMAHEAQLKAAREQGMAE
ncbi:MAG: lipopolysaccharide biosynthesis protein [Eggerthellaceae bacterium]|nr:lipopolysaccharide biosynthesis protein [Eggerthellaceae bacterium]